MFVYIPHSCLSSLLSTRLLMLVRLLACCSLSVSGFSLLVLFLLRKKKRKKVDSAINKVQFKGGEINSGTLGLSFGVLQGHPPCNVLRN